MANSDLPGLTEATSLADTDILYAVTDPGGGSEADEKIMVSNVRTAMVPPLLHVRDEKSAGTDGGGSSATTWNVRVLNTVKTNQITGASLASNQITLPAGTYRVRGRSPSYLTLDSKLRLRNVTDGTTAVVGANNLIGSGDFIVSDIHLWGTFTIAAEKDFELQHYTQRAQATDGFGNAANAGEVEVYAEVWIEQVS